PQYFVPLRKRWPGHSVPLSHPTTLGCRFCGGHHQRSGLPSSRHRPWESLQKRHDPPPSPGQCSACCQTAPRPEKGPLPGSPAASGTSCSAVSTPGTYPLIGSSCALPSILLL